MNPVEPHTSDGHQPEHPFTEPWQAQAFALTVYLHQQGVFSWSQWADALSHQLLKADAAEDGSDYYHRWVDALAGLLDESSLAPESQVADLEASWTRAANATPHGQAIELKNDPRRS